VSSAAARNDPVRSYAARISMISPSNFIQGLFLGRLGATRHRHQIPGRGSRRSSGRAFRNRSGQISWPPAGSSPGRQWAVPWPPMGRFSWPPTGPPPCRVVSPATGQGRTLLLSTLRRVTPHVQRGNRKGVRPKAGCLSGDRLTVCVTASRFQPGQSDARVREEMLCGAATW
jgi:hypothetical protein